MLRRALMESFPAGGTLMVTSAAAKDGKTITSVNLCASLAERGESTLLLELDVRQPAVDKVLHCTRTAPGFEEALAGSAKMSDVVQWLDPLSFHAALVHETPHDPCSLLSPANLHRVLAWARSNFKWTIVDAPPALPAADVSEILASVDASLMVVRARRTQPELVTRTAALLGNRLYGVVLNDATAESSPYYGYIAARQTRNQPAAVASTIS
jgi:capsular exopolysaccharide synthesis family protein